jgi:hypothetical protein
MFADIRAFVSLDAEPPTYMGFGIPMPPPEYQVLLHYLLSTLLQLSSHYENKVLG